MSRTRFSAFTLLVALPVVAAILLKVGSLSWNYWNESRTVSWAAFDEMPKIEAKSGRILLISYYSSSDPALYHAHYWASEEGGRVVWRYPIEPYALDMVEATDEQKASIERLFEDSMGSTGVGVIDLRGDKPRSDWWLGPLPGEERFEPWLLEFLDDVVS